MNDTHMKAEVNADPRNANAQADEKRGYEMPLFELPNMAMPGVFRGIAEQSVVRARENCKKMKVASGEMADVLRETYSSNAKGAADYGVKVIEISSENTTSAFDYLSSLLGAKTLSDIMKLSAAQSRKNFDAASAQSKELWDLAQKVATEAVEPITKSVTKVLQRTT